MWSCKHKFNLIWSRNLQTLVSTSRVGFQAASYHRTACLLSLEDKDLDSNSNVGELPRKSPSLQQKPEGMQGFRRSSQSKYSRIKTSLLQDESTGEAFRISSELKKLCVEDFREERKQQMRRKADLDSKAEGVLQDENTGEALRMWSEPKKRFVEDFRAERKQQMRRKADLDSKAEGVLQDENTGEDFRITSELKERCVEDFRAERKQQMRRKADLDSNTEVVFGLAPCLLALTQRRRKAYELLVKYGETSPRSTVMKVCEEAERQGVQITKVSKVYLNKVSNKGVHQGVCLRASPLSFLTLDSEAEKASGVPLWLVLERILDPMNLGAILRTAYFLGVDKVVSSLDYCCPLTPVVSKASSGVMEVMGVYGHKNLKDLLKVKAALGWQVVGTVGAEAKESHIPIVPCSDFHLSKPTLLLMGNEGDGLSPSLLSLCQNLLTVPTGRDLFPGIESLNVSVATGILLHSLLHQRNSSRRLTQQSTENETL